MLHERVPHLFFLDISVLVCHNCQRDKYYCPRRKLNHQLQLLKHQVTSSLRVKTTQNCDVTKQLQEGSKGIANKLTWVQKIAMLSITGAMCTIASDFLEIFKKK